MKTAISMIIIGLSLFTFSDMQDQTAIGAIHSEMFWISASIFSVGGVIVAEITSLLKEKKP